MQTSLKNICSIFLVLSLGGPFAYAQKEKKYIREGNREFSKNKFSESEVSYRKAREVSKDPLKAAFNIGDALYKQKKYKEASEQFSVMGDESKDKPDKSRIYHNLGNSLLQQNKLKESIEAYKEALRNNPTDLETKYNLAYAQNKLKQQQQQQKKNKKQDNKNKNKKDRQKNKGDKNQQNKDQQKQKQKQSQNKNQNQDQSKQQQPRPGKISKQDAMRILKAMQNDEKKVQAKVKKAKAKKAKVKTIINW